jgi:hypothetical protein
VSWTPDPGGGSSTTPRLKDTHLNAAAGHDASVPRDEGVVSANDAEQIVPKHSPGVASVLTLAVRKQEFPARRMSSRLDGHVAAKAAAA